jgi:hypothetical protein
MAARMTYDVTDEPTGDLYRSLLDFALTQCTEALLVTGRGELPLSILTPLGTLGPHLIASGRAAIGRELSCSAGARSSGLTDTVGKSPRCSKTPPPVSIVGSSRTCQKPSVFSGGLATFC